MTAGYFFLGRPLFGIPLRVHWSVVFLVFVLGGPSNPNPIRYGAMVFLILAHEYGHAIVARWFRATPFSIELHGFGGLCRWEGYVTPIGRACIASGGVWAQAVILFAAIGVGAVVEPPDNSPLGQLLITLVVSNVVMAVFNLIPIAPLDGAEAWMLPWLLAKRAWRRAPTVDGPRGAWRRLKIKWRMRRWKEPKGPTLH